MRLLLLRHAKSDWSDAARGDEDRPLTARGRKAAAAMGAYMCEHRYVPGRVLCSTARRTRETLEWLLPALGANPSVAYDESLYLAEWPRLLREIQAAPDAASPVLVIGHNPGLQELAVALVREPDEKSERARVKKLKEKFPTGALAVIDFDVKAWSDVAPGIGRLCEYVRPKELAGADGDD